MQPSPTWSSATKRLFDVSGRLTIMGWFSLAGVTFSTLFAIVVFTSVMRRAHQRPHGGERLQTPPRVLTI